MQYLHIMVPIAILIVVAIIGVLFWATRNGQFDDLERQGYNILLDDDLKPGVAKKTIQTTTPPEQSSQSPIQHKEP